MGKVSGNFSLLISISSSGVIKGINSAFSSISFTDKLSILKRFFFDKVFTVELTFVVRQKQNSGILKNATTIRKQINQNIYDQFRFNISGCNDIQNLNERNKIFE